MKYLHQITYDKNKSLHEQVKEHADVFVTTKAIYAERGQADKEKVWKDCYYGKLSEFAAYKYLAGLEKNGEFPYKPSRLPVLDILRDPNWEPDLQNKNFKFAVKSVTKEMSDRFGISWTFNQSPRDPILNMSRIDYKVVFVVSLSEYDFLIYGLSHTQSLKDSGAYCFINGLDLPKLKGKKLFVHANNIKPGVLIRVNKKIELKK